ncbi:ribonuclease III [Chloroflexota bacterium]
MTDLTLLQQTLGVFFDDPSHLEQSLVHSSYVNENPGFNRGSNEKLEFLGDAVLGLVIAEKLYRDYSQFSEGEMTKVRAALVQRETLARMAKAIKLGDYLFLGKGEEASGGQSKPSNLASALEAVIAAIFLDQGVIVTRDFILRLFDKELQKVVSLGAVEDYKSQLQELMQARQQSTPAYHLVEAIGPAHNRTFTVEVRVADTVLGRGSGRSKKVAETEAARSALERLLSNFTP